MAAYLSALGLNCALGQGKQAVAAALFAGDTRGMRLQSGWVAERALTVGAVPGELPALPGHPQSRNNQLLLAAALAGAVPLAAHGFCDGLRWLSSVGAAAVVAVPSQASLAGVGGGTPPMPDEEEPPACGRNSPDLRFSLSR